MTLKDFDAKIPASNSSGILVKLWRLIILEANIIPKLGFFINNYLNKKDSDKNDKIKSKSVILNDILSTNMSIKVFMYLLFNLLKMKSIKITITCKHSNDELTTHSIIVKNSYYEKELKEKK